ncbi:TPA: hypothetical protein ACTYSP_001067 [Citrobacter freundii]
MRTAKSDTYAHNGGHESIIGDLGFDFDGSAFRIDLKFSLGMHIGGRNEWRELVEFVNGYMHQQLHKLLERLRKITGYEWIFPEGLGPDYLRDLKD